MHLKAVTIKNFRALENIYVDFELGINVIVGPNAIGKTTVLEAIRLAKAMLAPRTQNESNQALMALGAIVPYDPSQIIFDAIARDPKQPVEIKCRYQLTDEELNGLEKHLPEIAVSLVQANIGQMFANPSQVASLLSSPQGQAAMGHAKNQLQGIIDTIRKADRICRLELTNDDSSGSLSNSHPAE